MTATATASVTAKTWEEDRIIEADREHAVARAVFTTAYAGDIEGGSTCGLLISYTEGNPDEPSTLAGPFVGYEQVTGTLAGRSGTFVLAVRGAHSASVARTDVEIVPGSGTGGLSGLTGRGSYAADAMTYTLTLDYELP